MHTARRLTGRTDWAALVTLYDALALSEIARRGAEPRRGGRRDGRARSGARRARRAGRGPDLVRAAGGLPALLGGARAGLLAKLGDVPAAARAYERAVGLECDPAVRAFLQEKKKALMQ